jgi:hypothetical protein
VCLLRGTDCIYTCTRRMLCLTSKLCPGIITRELSGQRLKLTVYLLSVVAVNTAPPCFFVVRCVWLRGREVPTFCRNVFRTEDPPVIEGAGDRSLREVGVHLQTCTVAIRNHRHENFNF